MGKQKVYALTVCILGLIALAGSSLTFAGGGASRSLENDQLPDIFEEEEFCKIVLKKRKCEFANSELNKKNNLSESDWMVHAWKLGMTTIEFNKIKKKYHTTREIVLGIAIYKQYEKALLEDTYSDEDRLFMLNEAADNGSEAAINRLFDGLKLDSPDAIQLAKKYAEKGSEKAGSVLKTIQFMGIAN